MTAPLVEKGAEALEPYVLAGIQRYLATPEGQARIGQLVDELAQFLIRKLQGVKA